MYISNMRFVWDEKKRKSNIRKHAYDFHDARIVFEGHFTVIEDDRQDYGETRYIGLGELDDEVVLIVFTTPDEDTIRIISMRSATDDEREAYYE